MSDKREQIIRGLQQAALDSLSDPQDGRRYRLAKALNEFSLIAIAWQCPVACAHSNVDDAFDAILALAPDDAPGT